MKKIFIIISLFLASHARAQETIYPAPPQTKPVAITNATIHVGNGQVINNGSIVFSNGKIEFVGATTPTNTNATVIDARGAHVYPALIMSATQTGLHEIASGVRGSEDRSELGDFNPNVRSISAYNVDSKIINVLRSNGILLANVYPDGRLIGGTSSTVQFDAWNIEDAVYKNDVGIHFFMPSLLPPPERFRSLMAPGAPDPMQQAWEKIENVKSFLRDAKAYNEKTNGTKNLILEATKPLFNGTKKLFVHCNTIKQMLLAIDLKKEFNIDVTIVGGADSYMIADLLRSNNISVILSQVHSLPVADYDDIDQVFKTPAMLQKAGVLFSITDEDGTTTGRNLAFNAGSAAAYGLSKEEALQSITLNAAKILGIADRTGSLEAGKDANIVVSEGDILDPRSSKVMMAFIRGRQVNLDDKHKQLFNKYKHKYQVR